MNIAIGGICLKIKSANNDFIEKAAEEFRAFSREDTDDHFLIQVTVDHIPQESDSIRVSKKANIFEVQSDEFSGWIDITRKTAAVRIADLAGVFNCFLRVFYSVVLIEYKGMLVHAAGLVFKDRGYLFAGASESGKTTCARMADKTIKVLSDELVIVRQIKGESFIFSSPFKGEFEGQISSTCVYLQAVTFLAKNVPNGLSLISKMEMFVNIMANVFFFAWDDQSNQKLISLVNRLCESVSGYKVDLFNYDIRRVIDGIDKNNNQEQASCLAES